MATGISGEQTSWAGFPSMSTLYTMYYHDITPGDIDARANVPVGTTNQMIQDVPVHRSHAECVLATLSVHLGRHLNLTNVAILLIEEEQGSNE